MPGSSSTAKGKVYDVDYIQNLNWCQVLIRGGFVGFVRDVRLQQVIEASMQLDLPVEVHHEGDRPKRIVRVTLDSDPPVGELADGLHFVTKLDVNEEDGKCIATFHTSDGEDVVGFTRDARMGSLLVTALRERWGVGYLQLDETTGEILRGKLNVEER